MARVLSKSRREMIEFFEQRLADWRANSEALGLDRAFIDRLQLALDRAIAAQDAFDTAQLQARSATTVYHGRTDTLHALGSSAVQTVRAHALTQTDPSRTLGLAKIPPIAERRRRGAPPVPERITTRLTNLGAIELTWYPPPGGFGGGGVYFIIERRFTNPDHTIAHWDQIAVVGEQRYLDRDLPPGGFPSVAYRITAARGRHRSDRTRPTLVLIGTSRKATPAGPEADTEHKQAA